MANCEDDVCMMDADCLNCAAHSDNVKETEQRRRYDRIKWMYECDLNCDNCVRECICFENTIDTKKLRDKYERGSDEKVL